MRWLPGASIAGGETVATFLAATTCFLLQHPDKLERLVSEIRGAFASYEEINAQAAQNLPYLQAIINEGLRLCPPGSQGSPRVSPGFEIHGRFIPAGVRYFVLYHSVYQMPNPTFSGGYLHQPLDNCTRSQIFCWSNALPTWTLVECRFNRCERSKPAFPNRPQSMYWSKVSICFYFALIIAHLVLRAMRNSATDTYILTLYIALHTWRWIYFWLKCSGSMIWSSWIRISTGWRRGRFMYYGGNQSWWSAFTSGKIP